MRLNFMKIRYPSPIYGLSMLFSFLRPSSNLTYLTNKPKVDKIPNIPQIYLPLSPTQI